MSVGDDRQALPTPRAFVAPRVELTEEAYRAGRPAALMDFLYRFRQTEIPPPGAPVIELNLTDLMLSEEVLAAIGTLPDLEVLLLGGTNVDDTGVQPLCGLATLKILGLRRTLVTDESLRHLARLPNLEDIYLSETSVSDSGMDDLATMDSLHRIALKKTRVTASGISRLQALASLDRLWMDATDLGDDGVGVIARSFPRLEVLFIGRTGVSDAGVAELTRLANLVVLSLEDTSITDASVAVLAGMKSLRRVNLRGTELTPLGLESLSTQRPDLEVFTGNASLRPATALSDQPRDQQNIDTSGQVD